MSRTSRTLHPILANPYGSTASNDQNCKVSGRVSPTDHAFLKSHFPFLPNAYDIIVSTLFANFIAELRAAIPNGTDPAYLGPSDPLYATLADVLARCAPRRSADVERDSAGTRAVAGSPSEPSEAVRVLTAISSDPKGRDESGADEGEEEEQRESGGGLVEEPARLNPMDLLKLLTT